MIAGISQLALYRQNIENNPMQSSRRPPTFDKAI
jgi:hypothetical protein